MKMIKAFEKGTTFPYGKNNETKTIKRSYEIADTVVTVKGSNKPLVHISWHDAIKLCNKMTIDEMGEKYCVYKFKNNRVKKNYSKKGYRLPTNKEWEAAARYVGRDSGYHTKSININKVFWQINGYISGCPTLDSTTNRDYAVFNQESVCDVKTKLPNGLGLYDMSGNVWEWVFNKSGSDRSMRGGSWSLGSTFSEVDLRINLNPDDEDSFIGFRPVRTLT